MTAQINSADCATLTTQVKSGTYGTPTARCSHSSKKTFNHIETVPWISVCCLYGLLHNNPHQNQD